MTTDDTAAGMLAARIATQQIRVESARPSARNSSTDEFVAFVEESRDRLTSIAYLLAGDHHRAEELVQHTYERVWRSWAKARAVDPFAYARRVLANLRVDTWRRTRREVLDDGSHDHPDVSRGADHERRVQERDAVVRALMAIPARQRRVVILRHLMDLPPDQVAAELGMPVGTVKSNASRGLARLRSILEAAEGENR